jgi:hypothetical protein
MEDIALAALPREVESDAESDGDTNGGSAQGLESEDNMSEILSQSEVLCNLSIKENGSLCYLGTTRCGLDPESRIIAFTAEDDVTNTLLSIGPTNEATYRKEEETTIHWTADDGRAMVMQFSRSEYRDRVWRFLNVVRDLSSHACSHEVQFGGLCVDCGENMTEAHSGFPREAIEQYAATDSYWSIEDKRSFRDYIRQYGTNWTTIAQKMGTKTSDMVRAQYFRDVESGDTELEQMAEHASIFNANSAYAADSEVFRHPLPDPAQDLFEQEYYNATDSETSSVANDERQDVEGPATNHHLPSIPEGAGTNSSRSRNLSQHASNHLRGWLDANLALPYPDSATKRRLAQECDITEKQVSTWMTNIRARSMNSNREEVSPARLAAEETLNIQSSDLRTSDPVVNGPYSRRSSIHIDSLPAKELRRYRGKDDALLASRAEASRERYAPRPLSPPAAVPAFGSNVWRAPDIEDEEHFTIKCICGFADDDGHTGGPVLCDSCDTWQHILCYYDRSELVPDVHECIDCNPRPLDSKVAIDKQRRLREERGFAGRNRRTIPAPAKIVGSVTQSGRSPDSYPADSKLPKLPAGWIVQWDNSYVLSCSICARVLLSNSLQLTKVLLRPDYHWCHAVGPAHQGGHIKSS